MGVEWFLIGERKKENRVTLLPSLLFITTEYQPGVHDFIEIINNLFRNKHCVVFISYKVVYYLDKIMYSLLVLDDI